MNIDNAAFQHWLETTSLTSTEDEDEIESLAPIEDNLTDLFQTGGLADKRIGRAMITVHPIDDDPKWLLPETYFTDIADTFETWCGQFERAPTTNTLHLHLYVEFTRNRRPKFASLKAIFAPYSLVSVDLRVPKISSKNQRQCAVNYVLDALKRAPSTESYVWAGCTKPAVFCQATADKRRPKAESKDETQRKWIESKPRSWSWDQIVHESEESKILLCSCSFGPKYHSGRAAEVPVRLIQNVIIFYGAGGTGKTTLAHKWDINADEDVTERYYRRNPDDGTFWGGGQSAYRGQRILHLEEFCGNEPLNRIKEVCDVGKAGPYVNIKNGGRALNHDTVLFTSNSHPAAWYRNKMSNDNKQWRPFARRITQVWFFPEKRPDGSDNVPDDQNPPYYIDQTTDFQDQDFVKSYEVACNHAETHWPMSDPDVMTDGISHPPTFNPASKRQLDFTDYARTGKFRKT